MTNEEYKLLLFSLGMTQREATTEIHGLAPKSMTVYYWTSGLRPVPNKHAEKIKEYRRKVIAEAERRRKEDLIDGCAVDIENPFERAVNMLLIDEMGI